MSGPIHEPHQLKSTYMGLKLIIGKIAHSRKGLKKHLQGITRALKVVNQIDKKGSRFKPKELQKRKVAQKNNEKGIALLLDRTYDTNQ